jgi:iron complex outermembrane receptor protein
MPKLARDELRRFSLCQARLMSSTALCGFIALTATSAAGQTQEPAVESVVVTGTSIKGVNPVGTNLITLDRASIDETGGVTIAQVLSSIPAVTGMGTGGNEYNQGAFGNTGETLPTIHGLGASSSQSTLVLIDGHPITPGNKDGYSDPSSIPAAALQRVDVLPDGASAIYGSNAVAGVINFITRSNFEGMQTKAQYGVGSSYNTFTFSHIAGHEWDTGGVLAVYEYKSAEKITNSERSFSAHQDLRPFGGTNYNSYSCLPAAISASSATSANQYIYPYATANNLGPASNADNAPCDYKGSNTILPSLNQNTGFVSLHQSLTDWLTVQVDLDFSSRMNLQLSPQAAITATAFGPTATAAQLQGGSINPFYVAPPGGTTASEFVRWDPTSLIGPSRNKVGARTAYANTSWTASLPHSWTGTLESVTGINNSFSHSSNNFCAACALLGLNGTTFSTGFANVGGVPNNALADPNNLSSITQVTRALTTANALDVWHPIGATNRTSQDVLNSLHGDTSSEEDQTDLDEVRLKFTGPVFNLPAGALRVAVGGEWTQEHLTANFTSSNAAGSAVATSRVTNAPMKRTVSAAFAELYIPVISAEMGVPLVQSLELDLAGRYDHYSDVGSTQNPKVGFTWKVVDGFSMRGSYGTSFTALNIDALNPVAIGSVGASTSAFVLPTTHVNYPGSFCTAQAGPCAVTAAQQGININAGNPSLVPAKGVSYSLGMTFDLGALAGIQGLTANVTYWQAKIVGGVTRPPIDNTVNVPALQPLLLLAPPGGWAPNDPAVLAALRGYPITSPLPNRVFYIYEGLRENAVNIQANGLDFGIQYGFDAGQYGVFQFGLTGAEELRFDIAGAIGAPYQDFLNGHQNASVLHSVAFTSRLALNWTNDPFSLSIFVNHVNPYWYPNASTRVATGLAPTTGAVAGAIYDKVSPQPTLDINAGWSVPKEALYGWGDGMKLTLNVSNILNSSPPFLDTPNGGSTTTQTGYDTWQGNLLGRVVRFGLEKKF